MQNWRFSYDTQKSKFPLTSYKPHLISVHSTKVLPEKLEIKKVTDQPVSYRKTNFQKIQALKSLGVSKSPKRENNLKYSPFKVPKMLLSRKNLNDSPQQTISGEPKSSTITDDSESNLYKQKTKIFERCPTYHPPQQKQKLVFLRKQKRERNLTQTSPPNQHYIPSRPSVRLPNKDRQATQKAIDKFCIKEGTKVDDFIFLTQLGRGYNSVVYLARHKFLGMLFAIKILCKNSIKTDSLKQNIFREIKIHSFIKHANLLTLYKILDDEKYIYMVMQYATNGTLFSTLKKQRKLNEQKTAKIVRDVCRGLKSLHDNNIIHRDLKLENILLTEGVAKIGDFGCAVYSFCLRKSKIGSPAYLSPEQLNHNFYGNKIDIWSLGIIVFEMLFEATPFDREIIQALNKGQLNYEMKVKFPPGIQISDQAKNFIEKCLQKKQTSRMDIDQVLNHPFLKFDDGPYCSPSSSKSG